MEFDAEIEHELEETEAYPIVPRRQRRDITTSAGRAGISGGMLHVPATEAEHQWLPIGSKVKHQGVCSTWGNFHFKTFDGELFHFPGFCNYLFAAHCRKEYEDFNIQIQQSLVNTLPTITQISMKVNGLVLELINYQPTIHGVQLKLPYNQNGLQIEKSNTELKITAKMVLVLVWHDDNSVQLTLNKKYMGETCGLCADYNGDQSDDFILNEKKLNPFEFGNLHKLRKPETTCVDPKRQQEEHCTIYRALCIKLLRSSKWARCNRLVRAEPYIDAYMKDMCLCKSSLEFSSFCLCKTITEYSRQCALAGGKPPNWRNPELCRHVKDDFTNAGCVPINNCSCSYKDKIYAPGESYQAPCYKCLCSGGFWKCEDVPCPSTCSVEGGSHITTFDKAHYTFHGQCLYVLAKSCADNAFLVTIEMQKCGYSETATCLTRVLLFLDNERYMFEINYSNKFPEVTYDEKIMAKAGVHVFWPSSFFLIVHTNKGLYLQVQITPIMQLFVILDPSYKKKTCGLCGNFNNIQKDDFRTTSGAIEGNVVEFANSWKTQYSCMNIKFVPEHPCTFGMEIEKYAHHWCNVLIDSEGPFAVCHASVNPELYQQKCLFDTCSCKRAEDCLCAALSSYAWACAAAGIPLVGWREDVCRNYLKYCPQSFVYNYTVTTCIPTCRSLTEPDPTCSMKFFPVDGCVCPPNTYLNERGVCVKKEACPCYYKGVTVAADKPLLFGRSVCVCKNRTWVCDSKANMGICSVYGEGHYITFDGKRYTINGDCIYTLVQDYCHAHDLQKGTFRVTIETIPCGTTGTSCSKAITVYLGAHKIILADGHFEVLEQSSEMEIPYKVRTMGIYLVIESSNGLVLVWNRATSIFIHLSVDFKGKVCGLCGNLDGDSNNDFTTRSHCVVEDVKEFRDSWKLSKECPEVYITKEPCVVNPYRVPWAQKRCSIINSDVFSECHSEVDPEMYYEACVSDTCACDMGGDCDCFCTAVAAYAKACSEACVCIDWRTPDVCPLFCDFYNKEGQCQWHYKACGTPCMKTCRNPNGTCLHHLKGLEGCYPECPADKPFFNEDEMICVSQCGCLDNDGNYYQIGEKVESCNVNTRFVWGSAAAADQQEQRRAPTSSLITPAIAGLLAIVSQPEAASGIGIKVSSVST
ncbi:mucin-5B-like [Spea bombifrons]|uniref:mucin-5B-like n=1 Tax=Spea bombifrons TaxID=233779 RepID=UPI0023497E7F|nr:mucin-5B-like [Spea bombifrons]